MKNKIIFNISDLRKFEKKRNVSPSDVFQPITRVFRDYIKLISRY